MDDHSVRIGADWLRSGTHPRRPHGPPVLTNSIVFVSTRGGTEQVFVMNADGTNLHALTTLAQGDNFSPSWTRY
jgi:hypothetical protein